MFLFDSEMLYARRFVTDLMDTHFSATVTSNIPERYADWTEDEGAIEVRQSGM
jgi:hypothetical protein